MTGDRVVASRTVLVSPIPPPVPYDGWTGTVYDVTTLLDLSALLMVESDPIPANAVEWLETFNEKWSEDSLERPAYMTAFRWLDLGAFGWIPGIVTGSFDPDRLAPHRVYADTLRDVVDYLAVFVPLPQNTLEELEALNGFTADEHLSTGQLGSLQTWFWVPPPDPDPDPDPISSSSGPLPQRYLRMNQRDDGMGIARAPRLAGTSSNGPTSVQSDRSIRLGNSNRYR